MSGLVQGGAASLFKGKTVLVTGGTGSFGHAFAEYLSSIDGLEEIRIFSRDELKQEQMRLNFPQPPFRFYIGDVREPSSVDAAMTGVDYVFHAAALKQVPTCEFFPMEAVLTNILGSHHVIESAVRSGVSKIIWLSTDKAVYPLNAMGATKTLMEKIGQAISRRLRVGSTVVAGVRYGNVMYSRGSVIPLFVKQILEGSPLTVTAPEMTRFMLPLQDAIALVTFAIANSRQGDTFIKKAPACTIGDLASALCSIFSVPENVRVIGMRHGEKIYETLASREELMAADDLGDYYRIRMDTRSLNYSQYFFEGNPAEAKMSDYTSENTRRLTLSEVEELLLALPELRSQLAAYRRRRGVDLE